MIGEERIEGMGLGKFEVSRVFLEREPDQVMRVMSRCLVVRAEFLFHKDAFEYIAWSREFEVPDAKEGDPVPILRYVWQFDTDTGVMRAIKEADL